MSSTWHSDSVEFAGHVTARLSLLAAHVDEHANHGHEGNVDEDGDHDEGSLCNIIVLVSWDLTFVNTFSRFLEL